MFQRAVTIIYDRSSDTIGFMDPHEYDDSRGQPRHRQLVITNLLHLGAVIACAPFTDMDHFVAWLVLDIFCESLYIPFEHQVGNPRLLMLVKMPSLVLQARRSEV